MFKERRCGALFLFLFSGVFLWRVSEDALELALFSGVFLRMPWS